MVKWYKFTAFRAYGKRKKSKIVAASIDYCLELYTKTYTFCTDLHSLIMFSYSFIFFDFLFFVILHEKLEKGKAFGYNTVRRHENSVEISKTKSGLMIHDFIVISFDTTHFLVSDVNLLYYYMAFVC